jgi:hypothetical protein
MLRRLRCFLLVPLAALSIASVAPSSAADPPPKAIRALLVNGRSGKERTDQATYYLNIALNPFDDKEPAKMAPVHPSVVSPAEFDKLTPKDLEAWDGIFLCDVARLTNEDVQRLGAFVRAGGGLVVCLGPQVGLDSYNAELFRDGKGLLPVRLLERRKAKEKQSFRFVPVEGTFKQPPLDTFANEAAQAALLRPKFLQFVRVGDPPPRAKVRTVLAFEEVAVDREGKGTTAGAAILEWRPFSDRKDRGGRVVLVTTTLDLEWNTWPLSASFAPMIHELARFIAADARRR